ncbi:MAG TPA: tRNA uridine-5-carboxymethylaminomethyl(34) synthesis enzyme MnmG, partial [Flavisolibacter sp.]
QERMDNVLQKRKEVEDIKGVLKATSIEPSEINSFFGSIGSALISEKQKLEKIVLRPNLGLASLMQNLPKLKEALSTYADESIEQAEIQIKYQVYIDKEKELVDKMRTLEDLEIPERFDYQRIVSLGAEAREKLIKVKPRTLGQASRISGINPADVQILMVYMGR